MYEWSMLLLMAVFGYVIGALTLQWSLRRLASVEDRPVHVALTYLAMYLGAGITTVVLIISFLFTAQYAPSIRPAVFFVIYVILVSLSEWFIGFLIMCRRIRRPGLVAAIPVIVISILGCVVSASTVAKAEMHMTLTEYAQELFTNAKIIQESWIAADNKNEYLPVSLAALAKTVEFKNKRLAIADLNYLPEYLESVKIIGPFRRNDLYGQYPLIWTKNEIYGVHVVIDVGGGVWFLSKKELAEMLENTVSEVSSNVEG